MMHRALCVARIPRAMLFTWLLAGCGSYDNGSKDAGTGGSSPTGGSPTSTGGVSTGGVSTGGVSTGGVSTGGASDTGGSTSGGAGGGGGSGGGTGPAACTDVAPCGGEVTGTWTAASCEMTISGKADMVPTGLGCNTALVTGSIKVSGTWTAMGDGKFEDKTTTAGEAVLELEKACLTISGFATTCDRIVLDPLGLTSVACVDNATTGGCTCNATINQSAGMASISIDASFNGPEGWSGTYTAADNKLVTTVAGLPTEYSYCTAGNTLTMNLTTVSKAGTLTGPIVLQKQ